MIKKKVIIIGMNNMFHTKKAAMMYFFLNGELLKYVVINVSGYVLYM